MTKIRLFVAFLSILSIACNNQINVNNLNPVSSVVMDSIYSEIQTPHKYGVVFKHPDSTKMIDSPTIFRHNDKWLMSYIIFDGQEIGRAHV